MSCINGTRQPRRDLVAAPDVDGSVVTLSGRVAEHHAAIGTAFEARDVTRGVDRLKVG